MRVKLFGLLLLIVTQTALAAWAQATPAKQHPTPEETVRRYKDATPATQENAKKLKKLGLAAFYFAEAHDWKFVFTAETFQDALKPYAKDDTIFYADDGKKQPFALNTNFVGIDFDKLASPSTIVMFYQGRDRKLDFMHQGYGLVCSGDGHVSLISKEESKALRWTTEIKEK